MIINIILIICGVALFVFLVSGIVCIFTEPGGIEKLVDTCIRIDIKISDYKASKKRHV
jgi:hypothetical protein